MLQLEHRLAELVSSLSGKARPCLLIDGIDKLEEPGGRQAVNDILLALSGAPGADKGVTRWSVPAPSQPAVTDEESRDASLRALIPAEYRGETPGP